MPRGKQITEQQYNQIKSIVDLLPKVTTKLEPLFQTLGTSSKTAARIKKSKDFEDYRAIQQSLYAKNKPTKHYEVYPGRDEVHVQQVVEAPQEQYIIDVVARHEIDRLEETLSGIAERLLWIEQNAVIGSSKRKFFK